MSQNVTLKPREHHPRERLFAGIALIIVGAFVLLANVTQSEVLGLLFLPVLGIALLLWGFYVHEFGFVIPGCILTGLGAGILIGTQTLPEGDDSAGVILLGLAAGFLALTLLKPFFSKGRVLWPLIPATVLGVIAVMLIVGGAMLDLLQLFSAGWPIVLIGVGVLLLLWPRRIAE